MKNGMGKRQLAQSRISRVLGASIACALASFGSVSRVAASEANLHTGVGFPPVLELSSLDGNNGFTIDGINAHDNSGQIVSGAGDINGDGIDDLTIGAVEADAGGRFRNGQSYVVFGSLNAFKERLSLPALSGDDGFRINGVKSSDLSGRVSAAGDVNGDGFDDLIIGAILADPGNRYSAGESYVVFGNNRGFTSTFELSSLNGENGFVINGINEYDISGVSVSAAGDLNADGYGDVIVGASTASPHGKFRAGESYVVFGGDRVHDTAVELSELDGNDGFLIHGMNSGDNTGHSVSNVGDINDDGIDDVIIGALFADSGGATTTGKCYVLFGTVEGFQPEFDLSRLNGHNGFVINGISAGDFAGWSVNSAGDVNGDGIDDLILGARGASPGDKTRAGITYVVYGSNQGFAASFDLSAIRGSNGFAINGIDAGDESGHSVSSAGDINGDGYDDVLIGAFYATPDNGNFGAGESYVVFGRAGRYQPEFELPALNGHNGFVINGIDDRDRSGRSVSGAGDINGDGIGDLIIGALSAGPNGNVAAGESYVVFGNDGVFAGNFE